MAVEGRTTLDVVVPPAVTFSETLVTVRSELDPFLHVEALTYVPPGGGGGGGGTGEGAGAGAGAGEGVPSEAGGGGGHFLTFGLSSWNCAVVGAAFLLVGLLLLAQPVLAVRRWWRETAAAGGGGGDVMGRGGGGGGSSVGGEDGGGGGRDARPRGKPRGQWRYGQVETDW